MNSRDRVLKSINHEEPDRVPIDFGGMHTSIHAIGEQKLKEYLGFKGGKQKILDYFQYIVSPDERLLEIFQSDVMPVLTKPASNYIFKINEIDDTYEDEWGNKYIRPKGGFFYDFKEHVMKNFTIKDINKFQFPNPSDKARVTGLKNEILNISNNLNKASVIFAPVDFAVDFMNTMRSYEQAYMDLATNLKIIEKLLEKNLEWQKLFWKNILDEIGNIIDIIAIGDDLGGQNGPLFNPKIFRNIFKPFYSEIIKFIKDITTAKIYLHSCGSVYEFIPDLIEVGIDILNPVQVSAKDMDTKKLKKEFGKDIVFWGGGCDSQVILPNKTPKEIEEEVKRRIDDLALGGGFVFAPIHNIQFNVPPANVMALFTSAIKYRKYK
ncbi:MAG: hypothetical protein M1409_03300 [Actinobacteria bacterium]|nr:hypothetical protein [Actinomycetota bacterium]